jgi:DNA-binding MarR family transcriptional regulator
MGPVPRDTSNAASIAVDLMKAMTRLRSRLRAESAPETMKWTWSQLNTLSRIVERQPITATELATAEHVRRQSMAETIAALRSGGLITSSQDPTDARRALIRATRQGLALSETIPAARERWLNEAIEQIVDAEERRTLAKAIAILNRIAESDS